LSLCLALSASHSLAETVKLVDEAHAGEGAASGALEVTEAMKAFSPYAGRKYPTRVFFGDTHHHTSNSGDAFMGGNRLSPEDAYRFARGEEVSSFPGHSISSSCPITQKVSA